jgi:hypothetical protein
VGEMSNFKDKKEFTSTNAGLSFKDTDSNSLRLYLTMHSE